jgi:hypothetical protein
VRLGDKIAPRSSTHIVIGLVGSAATRRAAKPAGSVNWLSIAADRTPPQRQREQASARDERRRLFSSTWSAGSLAPPPPTVLGQTQFGEGLAVAHDGWRFEIGNFTALVVEDMDFVAAASPSRKPLRSENLLARDDEAFQFHRRRGI